MTPTGQVTLTAADNGITVVIRPGDTVMVDLGRRGMIGYHLPTAIGSGLRQISASGGYPTQRPARAAYRATRATGAGRVELTSVTDARCLHVAPRCAFAQQLWRVTVIVR